MKKLVLAAAILLVPALSFASINSSLSIGSRGSEVSQLQVFLINKHFLNPPVSGYFGALTQKAVKSYQKSVGISATGSIGPLTRAKINAALVPGQQVSSTGTPSFSVAVIAPVTPKIDDFTKAKSVLNSLYAVGNAIHARTGTYEGICYDSTVKNATLPFLTCGGIQNSWVVSIASSSGETYCADYTSYVGPGKFKTDSVGNLTCGETPKGATPKPDITIKSPLCAVGALNGNTTLACSVTVVNDSDVAILTPFAISGLNTKMSVPSLNAHEEKSVRFTSDSLPNNYGQAFVFVADSGAVVDESNENNNKEEYIITVTPTSAHITAPVAEGNTYFGTAGRQISFTAHYVANGSPIVNVWWSYGDGYSSGTLTPFSPDSGDNTNNHVYAASGSYTVTFTLKTEDNREIVSDPIVVVIN